MVHPHTQKWAEDQRVAVCEHLYESHHGEHEKRSEQMMEERFEQQAILVPADRIDREAGILKRVHVMGVKSRHGYAYSIEAQRAVYARYEGMPVGIDHDYRLGPLTTDHTWGVIRNPEVDATGTWGDLHYNRAHVRTEQLLESIERGIGPLGLSAITTKCVEKDKVVCSFEPLRLDIVVGAATTRTMFEQSRGELDTINASLAAIQKDIAELKAGRVRQEQFKSAAELAAERAALEKQAAGGIDLKKFWND